MIRFWHIVAPFFVMQFINYVDLVLILVKVIVQILYKKEFREVIVR